MVSKDCGTIFEYSVTTASASVSRARSRSLLALVSASSVRARRHAASTSAVRVFRSSRVNRALGVSVLESGTFGVCLGQDLHPLLWKLTRAGELTTPARKWLGR